MRSLWVGAALAVLVVLVSGCTQSSSVPLLDNTPMKVNSSFSIPDIISSNSTVVFNMSFFNYGEPNLTCSTYVGFGYATIDYLCENAGINFVDQSSVFSLATGENKSITANGSIAYIDPSCGGEVKLDVSMRAECSGPCEPNRLPKCIPYGGVLSVWKNINVTF